MKGGWQGMMENGWVDGNRCAYNWKTNIYPMHFHQFEFGTASIIRIITQKNVDKSRKIFWKISFSITSKFSFDIFQIYAISTQPQSFVCLKVFL